MRLRRPLLALILSLPLLAAVGTSPAAAKLTGIGIADQKAAMFDDPRFQALHVPMVRRAVAWDALTVPWQAAELDDWMAKAKAAGAAPLLTMEHSRQAGRTRIQPTVAQLMVQFDALRARYPWVTDFSAWNEANCTCQATYDKPALVASYWKNMQQACPACHVLGADLLDVDGMQAWVAQFVVAAKAQPRYWGLHNYVTANRFQSTAVRQVLQSTTGELWLTETGGLVARRNKSKIKLPQGIAHAAQVTSYILNKLPAISPRITRAYFYQWNSDTPTDSWDSSFIGYDGTARPSLSILQIAMAGLPLPVATLPVTPPVPDPDVPADPAPPPAPSADVPTT